jgi:hypothetical protein
MYCESSLLRQVNWRGIVCVAFQVAHTPPIDRLSIPRLPVGKRGASGELAKLQMSLLDRKAVGLTEQAFGIRLH